MAKKVSFRRLKFIVVSLCLFVLILPTTALGISNFERAENFRLGAQPNATAVGDFNQDGLPDLVTANSYENQISILLNDRAGHYQEKQFPVGINPSDVAVGDLNGDNIVDIVTANSGDGDSVSNSSTVSVLIGQAGGEFKSTVNYNVYINSAEYKTFTPNSVTIGDFNKDSIMDLAVSNGDTGTNEYHIVLLLGKPPESDGTLAFSEPIPIQVGYKPSSITAGDINGDGSLDFIVTHSGAGKVSILTNRGNLTGMLTAEYPAGNNPKTSVIGDMNGDGHADIVVVTTGDSAGISILQGDGHGFFTPAVKFKASCPNSYVPALDDPYSLALADLDGDGDLDLAVGCSEATQVSILLNDSVGSRLSLQAADRYSVQGSYSQVVIADFNSDNKLDVVATNYDEFGNNMNFAAILLGRGDGTLLASVNYDVSGSLPLSVTSFDFDGDGNLDIATANYNSNNVSIMRGNGKGQFAAAIKYAVGSKPVQLLSVDLNHDGKPDLVIANSGDNTITRLLNDGTGSFISKKFDSSIVPNSKARTITVADFNGDNNPDLAAVHTGSNQLSVMLGDGKGEFELEDQPADNRLASPNSIVSGYFNDDDKIDLAIANKGTKKVYILYGQGDGTFTSGGEYGGISEPSELATGDFNRDGWTDIAVANNGPSGYSLHILFGDQTGTFRDETISTFPNQVYSLAVGDYNGDEKLDIAVPALLQSISVFMGDGTGSFSLENSYSTDVAPRSVAAGDYNNDGKDDLATANDFAGNVTIIKSFPPKWKVKLAATTYSAKENSGSAKVIVSREGNSTGVTSVVYATSDGTAIAGVDYTATTGTLQFQDGETSQFFMIPIVNNHIDAGNKSLNVQISAPSADAVIGTPSTAVLQIEKEDRSSSSSDSGSSATQPGNLIILDGVKLDKLTTLKEVVVGGQSTTIVSIDTEKLIAILEGKNNQTLIIPVTSISDVIQTELNGKMIKSLEKTNTVIEIRTNDAIYTIQSNQLKIDQIASQFGNNVKLEDIKLSIHMGKPSAESKKSLDSAAANQNVTLVAPAINFEIIATYGDRTIKIDRFDHYVSREIVLPNLIDSTQITTGVVLNTDGTISHIPTNIFTKDGKTHAVMNSLTNSIYSIIWNSKKFADVQGHWSQNDVNNTASRLIVDGVTTTSFQPDQDVNRAEFLAIVVRALGLKSMEQINLPQDVKSSDWYASVVQAALTYQLVQGYEDNTFRPYQTITRQEAAVILSRAMAITSLASTVTDAEANTALSPFEDSQQVSGWAKRAVALMVINNIMQGDNQHLTAASHLTRAQTAAIVTRLLQQAKLINK
ncbi:FG-GAP-like repeat-containing protein [Paenibacillus sp. HWE-109]|uniref:FG-GAP-like repeat-containing protein n=1 Tax=Paenibacillus sp. HWE-109 TaxID=1306526 RepID=UPI001EDF523D|nr:FG-GAP-like repeat-containing protein [Paenibacillus sp. HWE-109]UKS30992.1 FG-GAP-like repeat-containing protein [Paenibacillus sp. HWE-109]